jgi:putative peptidoglycan lipid II flippase
VVTAGWLLVMGADAAIVPFVSQRLVVAVLGICNTVGLTAAGIVLIVLVRRSRGPAALAGLARATGSGLAGAAAGIVVGLVISELVPASGFFANVGLTLLVSAVATLAFAAVVAVTDGGDLRSMLVHMLRRA